ETVVAHARRHVRPGVGPGPGVQVRAADPAAQDANANMAAAGLGRWSGDDTEFGVLTGDGSHGPHLRTRRRQKAREHRLLPDPPPVCRATGRPAWTCRQKVKGCRQMSRVLTPTPS